MKPDLTQEAAIATRKKWMTNVWKTITLAALASAAIAGGAKAQDFPARPIRLVIPFGAGGPADTQARWLGSRLAILLGQPVVVDNRVGAGGIIGTQAVVAAPADGHTLLFSSVGPIAIAPYIADRAPYNPREDLVPVVRVSTAQTVLVTAQAAPWQNLAGLIAHARAHPGKVSFASAGPGTTTQLGSELLKHEAGVDMVHIPYRGAQPALVDVMAGTVDVMFADVPVVLPLVRSGKLKALAIGAARREAALGDVPTMAESGYGAVLVSTWYGLLAPARTPPAILGSLNAAVNAILATPEGKAWFTAQGLQPNGGSAQDFGVFIQSESTRWTALAKAAGVRMD